MTRRVLVVGSGASAVHFAQTVLAKGYEVSMVDIGHKGSEPPLPDATFAQLRDRLDDPAGYFLGPNFEGVVLPHAAGEFYGFPPSKQFAIAPRLSHDGFEPLESHARGGLAEVWTAGCYPFNDDDLREFPFRYETLGPFYSEVARRIGVTGAADDLARFMPLHDHLLPPLRLDAGSLALLQAYEARRERFNRTYGAFLGRTRVATLSEPHNGRDACDYLGRCLWGCPRRALYTPSLTLAELQGHRGFHYLSGLRGYRLTLGENGQAVSLTCRRVTDGTEETIPVEQVVLAAGTLGSAEIFLRSLQSTTKPAPRLAGLMDNRQVLIPFVQWRMIGKPREDAAYQYHLIGMGIPGNAAGDYVHCQIVTLKTALLHPILQRLPFDLRTSIAIGRVTAGALGVVNVNFADTRRPACEAWLEDDRLSLRYVTPAEEPERLASSLRTVRRVLRELGCFMPPGLQHIRPMGASVHYAGLVPMTTSPSPLTASPNGQSRDIPNLYFADGITFPALPSKNLTFTLMANAVRIASDAF